MCIVRSLLVLERYAAREALGMLAKWAPATAVLPLAPPALPLRRMSYRGGAVDVPLPLAVTAMCVGSRIVRHLLARKRHSAASGLVTRDTAFRRCASVNRKATAPRKTLPLTSRPRTLFRDPSRRALRFSYTLPADATVATLARCSDLWCARISGAAAAAHS